jgi:hypothetical protein
MNGNSVLATVDVNVLNVSYSPQSGPVFTKVVFAMDPGTTYFSPNSSVQIDAVFSPPDFSDEYFSITHSGSKIHFDPSNPSQLALAVADAFPSTFMTSSNPAVAGSMTGTVRGLVTLIDGDKQCTLHVTFEISSAGQIGQLVNGVFQDPNYLYTWQANTPDDFAGADPAVYAYAQIVRPANEFTASSPATLTAQIRSLRDDGTFISKGVMVQFVLIFSDPSKYVYQTQKPMIFVDNPAVEGDWPEVAAIACDDNCSIQIIRLPQ